MQNIMLKYLLSKFQNFMPYPWHCPSLIVPAINSWRPYISHKIKAKNHILIFSTSSFKQPAGGASYYGRRLPISINGILRFCTQYSFTICC